MEHRQADPQLSVKPLVQPGLRIHRQEPGGLDAHLPPMCARSESASLASQP